jgi:hypothetical protein
MKFEKIILEKTLRTFVITFVKNNVIKFYFVTSSIPCNIFLPFRQCMKCFGVNELSIFEPKAKNTFPSFRTQ